MADRTYPKIKIDAKSHKMYVDDGESMVQIPYIAAYNTSMSLEHYGRTHVRIELVVPWSGYEFIDVEQNAIEKKLASIDRKGVKRFLKNVE
jgi:hypothetical protein